tara:strand:+ start:259 stop:564 length:306 start_codon:yes stop_codon:yes gene_type:complete
MEAVSYPSPCDKCGEDVEVKEDATMLEAIAYDKAFLVFGAKRRHILCSPSRAQFIVHDDFEETIDERQAYDKRCLPAPMRKSREALWTSAWEILQKDGESD